MATVGFSQIEQVRSWAGS